MFNHASGQLLPEHTWNPRCANFSWTCSARHQGYCCARRNPRHLTSICTQGTERCSCDKTAALARHKHTWISLRPQRNMFRQNDCWALTPRAHLDLAPCASKKTDMFMRRTAAFAPSSTLGSLSACKETCSGKATAGFSRREHTWISPRAQARRLTCSCDALLRSHATSTLGSLSVRKETCSGKTIAAF